MDKLFIPTKLKVGYQKRDDTYTKRLAYVIYYDSKGVLRKEKSFEGWRDKKIKTDEHENKPHSGFVLNKGVQRYGHWGSGRNMVRVYDDRGIEFEITVSNLMFILMTTDCLKRGLEGEFVYAWWGAELILLPTGCEEYKESQDFTALQDKKMGVKDMIPGCSYRTKKAEDIIYIGRFDWHEMDYAKEGRRYGNERVEYTKPKQHIFYRKGDYREFFTLSGLSSIAAINSDVPVSNYADLMDKFNARPESSPTVALAEKPYKVETDGVDHYGAPKLKDRVAFVREADGSYTKCQIDAKSDYNSGSAKGGYTFKGYTVQKHESHLIRDGHFRVIRQDRYTPYETVFVPNAWGNKTPEAKTYTEDELKALPLVKVLLVQKNGRKITAF